MLTLPLETNPICWAMVPGPNLRNQFLWIPLPPLMKSDYDKVGEICPRVRRSLEIVKIHNG